VNGKLMPLNAPVWRCTQCGAEESIPEDGKAPATPSWRGSLTQPPLVQHGCPGLQGTWSKAVKVHAVLVEIEGSA